MGTMKHIGVMLATIGLFAVSGATHTAQADAISTTLYTAAMRAGLFGCNVVNVSNKTLIITISIIDPDGHPLFVSPPTQTKAGTEVSGDFGDPTDPSVPAEAYCKVQVSGTGNRDDLRVVLTTSLSRTFHIGSLTNIPAFVVRQIEGH
jgi:hypothetical protein